MPDPFAVDVGVDDVDRKISCFSALVLTYRQARSWTKAGKRSVVEEDEKRAARHVVVGPDELDVELRASHFESPPGRPRVEPSLEGNGATSNCTRQGNAIESERHGRVQSNIGPFEHDKVIVASGVLLEDLNEFDLQVCK